MYLRHWGFHADPFALSPANGLFLEGASHDEALARMEYLVEQSRTLGLVVGESGIGKTCLLEAFARDRKRRGEGVISVSLAQVDAREFLWSLAAELGLNPADEEDAFRLWRRVNDRLSERRYQQLRTLLIGDDAHLVSETTLVALNQLLQQAGAESRFTVLLAMRPGAPAIVSALEEYVDLQIELAPWDEAETAAFLRLRLDGAGGSQDIFDPRAIARLHTLSRGVPRVVRRLAELSLAAGAVCRQKTIDERTVESAYVEIFSTPPATSAAAGASGLPASLSHDGPAYQSILLR